MSWGGWGQMWTCLIWPKWDLELWSSNESQNWFSGVTSRARWGSVRTSSGSRSRNYPWCSSNFTKVFLHIQTFPTTS